MANSPSPLSLKKIYRRCRRVTGLDEKEWGYLFSAGNENAYREVYKKEADLDYKASRKVSLAEALTAQLLERAHLDGYDIKRFSFNEDGEIINLPKKTTGDKKE